MVAKAIDSEGLGPATSILAAAQWMLDPDGNPATADAPSIINNSWAGADANQPWLRSVVAAWRASGIIPVFAAGNSGSGPSTITSPADYPEVFTVGASAENGAVADFSSRGPVLCAETPEAAPVLLARPDLVAPGQDILAATRSGTVAYWDGTSMAAPLASGILALMRQANPGAGVDQILEAARAGALPLPGGPAAVGSGLIRFSATKAPKQSSLSAALPSITNKRTVSIKVELLTGTFYRVAVNGRARGGSRSASVLTLALPVKASPRWRSSPWTPRTSRPARSSAEGSAWIAHLLASPSPRGSSAAVEFA